MTARCSKTGKKREATHSQEDGTPTKHGHWTPEVSEAASRELRELAQETEAGGAATESVDKSHLSVSEERHPGGE